MPCAAPVTMAARPSSRASERGHHRTPGGSAAAFLLLRLDTGAARLRARRTAAVAGSSGLVCSVRLKRGAPPIRHGVDERQAGADVRSACSPLVHQEVRDPWSASRCSRCASSPAAGSAASTNSTGANGETAVPANRLAVVVQRCEKNWWCTWRLRPTSADSSGCAAGSGAPPIRPRNREHRQHHADPPSHEGCCSAAQ